MKILRVKLDREIGFEEVRSLAKREAGKYIGDPLILSWLNRKRENIRLMLIAARKTAKRRGKSMPNPEAARYGLSSMTSMFSSLEKAYGDR